MKCRIKKAFKDYMNKFPSVTNIEYTMPSALAFLETTIYKQQN